MTLRAVVDNDIALKGACYELLDKIAAAMPLRFDEIGVLGAAPYVIRKKIEKVSIIRDPVKVVRAFEYVLRQMHVLEPTDAEVLLAADIEALAQRLNFALDFGESQLCAIVICRQLDWLLTGDKRAIIAFEKLLAAGAPIQFLSPRIVCLEQILFLLVCFRDSNVRESVCAEPAIDKALTIAFSCGCKSMDINSCLSGLRSYIEFLRCEAPSLLAPV